MIDLTKIEKPLCLLDAETREALEAYEGPTQFLDIGGSWQDVPTEKWGFYPCTVIRATPQQLIAPTYPWDALHERFKWCAIGRDNEAYAYEQEPRISDFGAFWEPVTGYRCTRIDEVLSGYKRGGYGWETSLMRRPE